MDYPEFIDFIYTNAVTVLLQLYKVGIFFNFSSKSYLLYLFLLPSDFCSLGSGASTCQYSDVNLL
jgi:hypothetical protein